LNGVPPFAVNNTRNHLNLEDVVTGVRIALGTSTTNVLALMLGGSRAWCTSAP
jgi:hypothetical protein